MMTWEEFLRFEEERELKNRQERIVREQAEAKPKITKVVDKKAEQRALKDRIMGDAQKRWEEGNKKQYELAKPPMAPVAWLVFDRATGELYGEATKMRAHQAWAEVNPTKLVHEAGVKEPYLVAIGFNACRCILRSEWVEAEATLRKKRSNGHVVT